MMTLWPISDEVTAQIMSDFYDAAHNSANAPEALAEVQRNWLTRLNSNTQIRLQPTWRSDFTWIALFLIPSIQSTI